MRVAALVVVVAWFTAGQAAAAESAAEAVQAFALVGTWSIDCAREPGCDKSGCSFRLTVDVLPSGSPTYTITAGTVLGSSLMLQKIEFTIDEATRLTDDKLRMISTQRAGPAAPKTWLRQPGERWELVVLKVGGKLQTLLARREDGKKITTEDGFAVTVPPDTKPNELPTRWVRTNSELPLLEKCGS